MAKTPTSQPAANLASELDSIVEDAVRKLKADVERTLADAQESAGRATEVLSKAGRLLVSDAADRSRDFAAEARERSRVAADRASEEIRAHPITTVAAAAGIGLILGALLTRRD